MSMAGEVCRVEEEDLLNLLPPLPQRPLHPPADPAQDPDVPARRRRPRGEAPEVAQDAREAVVAGEADLGEDVGGVGEEAVDLPGLGGGLLPGVAGGGVAAGEEELVGEDEHRLSEVESGLDGRAGDGDHGAGQGQLFVGEATHFGPEDQGGGGVRRILGEPRRQLPRGEEGDAQASVASGGGAHHAAEGGEGLRETRDADGAVEHCVGAHGEGAGRAAERRRRLHQEEAGEPQVGHGPGGGPDVALLPRPDEDDGGGSHYRNPRRSSRLKTPKASSPRRQTTTRSSLVPPWRKRWISVSMRRAARSMGKPKLPVEMAGRAIDFIAGRSARARRARTAAASFLSSSPAPITGPTAWITRRALRWPAPVITAVPTGVPPIRLHSSWIEGPPLRRMAPATPVPSWSCSLAGLTIASTSRSVMSPSTSSSWVRSIVTVTRFSAWFSVISAIEPSPWIISRAPGVIPAHCPPPAIV